jgi:hypothetical protein
MCNVTTAYYDVQAALQEVIELRNTRAEEYREMELDRLDGLLHALQRKIRRGDAFAIEVARKLSESRRKLLGLDAPMKVAPTNPAGDKPFASALTRATAEELAILEDTTVAILAREPSGEAAP